MSLRLDELEVAARGSILLGDSAAAVAEFVTGHLNRDGGFGGRSDASDLYYTVFATNCLVALKADFPSARVADFLRTFGGGDVLDFVHLACLARCWANLSQRPGDDVCRSIAAGMERHRCGDGGYNQTPGAPNGTAYACFLAIGAHQDLGADIPDASGLWRCIASLRSADGGYANQPDMKIGTTPATAAAIVALGQLGKSADGAVGRWLFDRCCRRGGFLATPAAPIPDLLSTATALHALVAMGANLETIREPCLDFLDSLWDACGAFRGNWAETQTDCEYTFYGLLALGHLGG